MFILYALLITAFCNAAFVQCMEDQRWQQLDNIPYTTGGIEQTVILEPRYIPYILPNEKQGLYEPVSTKQRTSSKKRSQDDVKSFLRTNPLTQPDTERMKRAYDEARILVACYAGKKVDYDNGECVSASRCCIAKCNIAGINEDHLGKFAFEQMMANKVPDIYDGRVTLFFSCLKHYNKTLDKDDTICVTSPTRKLTPLAKSLNLPAYSSEKKVMIAKALKTFIDDMARMHEMYNKKIESLVKVLYADKVVEQAKSSSAVVDANEWKNKFLYAAFDFCIQKNYSSYEKDNFFGTKDDLRNLISMIDEAKKRGFITNEDELGSYLLHYEPTITDTFCMMPWYVSYKDRKYKMSLLCSLIKVFNDARGCKTIPSERAAKGYSVLHEWPEWHIAYPDGFDSRLLDSNHVAFSEFEALWEGINNLSNASESDVLECLTQLYPHSH